MWLHNPCLLWVPLLGNQMWLHDNRPIIIWKDHQGFLRTILYLRKGIPQGSSTKSPRSPMQIPPFISWRWH